MIPFPIPPGGWERSWIYIIFYVFPLKCLFLKAFQAENGIFTLFSPKIRTWQTMTLKVGFFPGFKGLLTDCSLFTGRFSLVLAGSLINKRWKWSWSDHLESTP
jgi:ABC-type uncharacterized transport system permease subunit